MSAPWLLRARAIEYASSSVGPLYLVTALPSRVSDSLLGVHTGGVLQLLVGTGMHQCEGHTHTRQGLASSVQHGCFQVGAARVVGSLCLACKQEDLCEIHWEHWWWVWDRDGWQDINVSVLAAAVSCPVERPGGSVWAVTV